MNEVSTKESIADNAVEAINTPEYHWTINSWFTPNKDNLRLLIEAPGIGSAQTFFVRHGQFGRDGIAVIHSGYFRADPQGAGLGTRLLTTVSHVLQALACDSGLKIAYPLSATSDESRKLYARFGYEPYVGKSQPWVFADPDSIWNIKIYSPDEARPKLTEQENILLEQFKVLEPKIFDRY